MRTKGIVRIFVTTLALIFAVTPRTGRADPIVFQDRVTFTQTLQSDPSLATTVEGWDTYSAGMFFANG